MGPAVTDGAPALALHGVTKAYPGVLANDDVSFDVKRGEIHALMGENGAGKSTLAEIVSGLQRPDTGEIRLLGEVKQFDSPRDAVAAGVGFVQQHFALIPTLSLVQNLVLALRAQHKRVSLSKTTETARAVASRYGIKVDLDTPVERLSISQQQKAEVIKALALDPAILILDEATAVLTPQEADELAELVRHLARDGLAVILISHKFGEVLGLAERITVMRRGRVVGTVDAASSTREALAQMTVDELAPLALSDPGDARPSGSSTTAGPARLSVRDLHVARDDGAPALRGVSFEVGAGEVLGIAGVDGSGQNELLETIVAVRAPQSGELRIDGSSVAGSSVRTQRRRGVAWIPADRRAEGLVETMTVAENLVLPNCEERRFSRLKVLRRRAVNAYARELIDRFDIRALHPGALANQLSGGNQQKVVLARELAGNPRIVCATHPTRGLDFAAADTVRREILACRASGAAVLYASLEIDELLAVSDRVLVLNHGEVSGIVPTRDLDSEKLGLMIGGQSL